MYLCPRFDSNVLDLNIVVSLELARSRRRCRFVGGGIFKFYTVTNEKTCLSCVSAWEMFFLDHSPGVDRV